MTTPSNNSQMHNDIMAVGSREHPPILAPVSTTTSTRIVKICHDCQATKRPRHCFIHTLFDILKQHQNEVNEIRVVKIARNANPLALVAASQHYPNTYSPDTYYQAPKPHKTHTSSSRHTTSTSSYATTRNKGKEIAKPITPSYESASEENMDTSPRSWNDRKTRQFGNQRTVTVAEARETVGNQEKDYEYHKEKMMLCKQESKGVSLSAEQDKWLHDTDDEPDKQELEAHYMYMAKIQEVLTHFEQPESINDTYVVETVDSNVIPDSSYMCDNEGTTDQNVDEPENECVLLASLIANFKLDLDENKKSQKQLKKANTSLTHELDKSKQDLVKNIQDLKISKQDFSYCKSELEKYKIFQTNHKDKEAELKCAKALGLSEETKRLHNEFSKIQSYTTFCVKEENAKLVNQISSHEIKRVTTGKITDFDKENSDFGSKVTHLENIIAQKTKDFDDVKLELSNIIAKFEAYFEKLKNTKVVLE
ncbi:hypothetical protein Tco_0491316 [Tanacetum coccineum]